MKLEMITEGLKKLLLENRYNPSTIRFYEREWEKIHAFLINEYGDTEFEMERGIKYLEDQYNLISRYNDGSLSQQSVQLLRVVHMLEDYHLHKVLTRRYYASKNPLTLDERFETLTGKISADYAEKIHMPPVSKSARIPSSIPLLAPTCSSLHLTVKTRGWTYTSKISAMPGTQTKDNGSVCLNGCPLILLQFKFHIYFFHLLICRTQTITFDFLLVIFPLKAP